MSRHCHTRTNFRPTSESRTLKPDSVPCYCAISIILGSYYSIFYYPQFYCLVSVVFRPIVSRLIVPDSVYKHSFMYVFDMFEYRLAQPLSTRLPLVTSHRVINSELCTPNFRTPPDFRTPPNFLASLLTSTLNSNWAILFRNFFRRLPQSALRPYLKYSDCDSR